MFGGWSFWLYAKMIMKPITPTALEMENVWVILWWNAIEKWSGGRWEERIKLEARKAFISQAFFLSFFRMGKLRANKIYLQKPTRKETQMNKLVIKQKPYPEGKDEMNQNFKKKSIQDVHGSDVEWDLMWSFSSLFGQKIDNRMRSILEWNEKRDFKWNVKENGTRCFLFYLYLV